MADSSNPLLRVRGLLVCIVVVLFQFHSAYGFWHVLELSIADDCFYLSSGRRLFSGTPDWPGLIAWSGPYHVLYGLLDLASFGAGTPDAMCFFLAIASSATLLWALTAVMSIEMAGVATLLWATGSPFAGGMNGVYIFGATSLFLAAGFLFRGREVPGSIAALIALATRPEVLLWLSGAGFVAALLGKKHSGFLVAGSAGLLLFLQLQVDTRDRAGLAFRQHYALARAEQRLEDLGALPPDEMPVYVFDHPEKSVRESFGDATTLPQAIATNPGEVARHIMRNIQGFVRLLIPLAGRFPGSTVVQTVLGVIVIALAGIGLRELLLSLRSWRRGQPFSQWTTALIVSAPLLCATSIFYGSRLAYIIGAFLPLALLAELGRLKLIRRFPIKMGQGSMLTFAVFLILAVIVRRPQDGPPSWSLKWRRIVAVADSQGGSFAVVGNPYGLNILLSGNTKLHGMGDGLPDGVNRLLLHATELSKFACAALPSADEEQVRRVLEGGGWRPLNYTGEVLVLERKGL